MKRLLSVVAALALVAGWQVWAAGAAAQDAPAGWGTVKGQVVYGGAAIPQRMPLKVDKDTEHCLAKGPILDEKWVVDPKTKGVRDVFVWIENADGTAPPVNPKARDGQPKEVSMDQPHCRFVPHALALEKGTVFVIKNGSPITHNFNYQGHPLRNPGGNFLMPPNSKIPIKNLKADKLPIHCSCNIHPWMEAWMRVFDHPYYAVTGPDGTFEIKLAPAGSYRLKVWHPASGWMGGAAGRTGTPITIQADQTADQGKLKIQAR